MATCPGALTTLVRGASQTPLDLDLSRRILDVVATQYTGIVLLEDGHGGEAGAVAAISDLDSDTWIGEVDISVGRTWEPGPVTVRLLDSRRAGEVARAQADGPRERHPVILRGLGHFTPESKRGR